jgi:cobalt-zinc-cadmium efflux system membrane fusion protein
MSARRTVPMAWLLLAALWAGCEGPRDEGPRSEPGTAPRGVVAISPEVRARAGLVVQTAAKSRQQTFLTATGWLVAKPGAEVGIKAPAAGFITRPSGEKELEPGFRVERKGQRLGDIQVVLSAQEQADLVAKKEEADVLIRQSLTSLELAEAQLDRLEKTEDVVSGARLAELKEKVEHARAAYEEAKERLPFLPKEPYDDPIQVKPVPVESPLAGRVVSVHVRPGQFVAQGDPLWTIADWSLLWVRVPVFELELPQVDRQEPAELEVPGTDVRLTAQPVDAPQPTRYGQRTVDRYYEVPNPAGALRVGQAVSVLLPTGGVEERIVLPHSAVLWDGMGNTWVYLETGANVFRRQRVELGPAVQQGVQITRGLEEGAKVVTAGAEMLYGEEFKEDIAVEDND